MSREARLSDRVKQLSFDPSTNTFSLDSVATGFSPFRDFYEDGDVVFYAATDGTRYEMGSGEYNNNTLTRYPLRSTSIASGPYYLDAPSANKGLEGVTGVWHPMYLTASAASGYRGYDTATGKVALASGVHEHTFSGYPGVTFYMPKTSMGSGDPSSVTKSGVNYATSGTPVNFQGVTEVFVTYPGKYSVFTGGGISGFKEPKKAGVAFWGNEQTLDYDVDIVWNTGNNTHTGSLGIQQPDPKFAVDVGGLVSYSQIRSSGFIDGGSGVTFSGGQSLQQDVTKTASGGRQLEPFYRSEVDNQTKTDQVFSLSGLVDQRLLFKKQYKGMMLAGPPSGCTSTCSPDFPHFRYLELEDIPDLSDLYVVQQNYVPYDTDVPAGSVAFTTASGKIEYSAGTLVFNKSNNKLGINTPLPQATLDVNGNIKASGDVGVSGLVEVSGQLRVGGNVIVSGDLDVLGTLTHIDSTRVTVLDKQLELASVSGAPAPNYTDQVIDSGGLVLKTTSAISGDKAFVYSEPSGAWWTNQSLALAVGQKIKFDSGPEISGGYSPGSGLEIHNLTELHVGNIFQVSGEDGTNGYIHQGSILTVSGISGIDTTYTQLHNSGRIVIDPTYMYNSLSGQDLFKIHANSGTCFYLGQADAGEIDSILPHQVLTVSGVTGVFSKYDSTNNALVLDASPISGWVNARFDGIGAGYGNWKMQDVDPITSAQNVTFSGVSGIETEYVLAGTHGGLSTNNLLIVNAVELSGNLNTDILVASGNAAYDSKLYSDVSGQVLKAEIDGLGGGYGNWKMQDVDPITSAQNVTFSGVSGIETEYVLAGTHGGLATNNLLIVNAVELSGNLNHSLFSALSGQKNWDTAVASGNQLDFNKFGAISGQKNWDTAVASGNYLLAQIGTAVSYGSGIVKQKDTIDFRHDGSGTLKHLMFHSGIRIGTGAGFAEGTPERNANHSIEGAIMIGTKAGYESHSNYICSGLAIGNKASYQSYYQQDGVFIGRSAGQAASGHPASGQRDMIAIGRNAARKSEDGDWSTYIGLNAGLNSHLNNSVISIGQGAGMGVAQAEDAILIGTNAGHYTSGINQTLAIGRVAGSGSPNKRQGIFIGYRAGIDVIDSGLNPIMIGTEAGASSSGLHSNHILIGNYAGVRVSGSHGGHSIGIGNAVLRDSNLNERVVALGGSAGIQSSGNKNALMIGTNAGIEMSGGSYVNAIGFGAGYQAIKSDELTGLNLIGWYAGQRLGSGVSLPGDEAGLLTGGGVTYSDFIGYKAGYAAWDMDYAQVWGAAAGMQSRELGDVIIIGKQAGSRLTTSDNSIIMGDHAGYGYTTTFKTGSTGFGPTAGVDHSIIIGELAGANSSGLYHSTVIGYGSWRGDNPYVFDQATLNGTDYSSQRVDYSILIGDGVGSPTNSVRAPGSYNCIIEPRMTLTNAQSWCSDWQDNIVSIAALMHGYSDHVSMSKQRYLQVGDFPTSLSALQEATLSIKPDQDSHVNLKLRRSAAGMAVPMLKAEMPANLSNNEATIVNEQGINQIFICDERTSAGEYRIAGKTTTVQKNPGTMIFYDDGSTRRLLICNAAGNWYKINMSAD